MKGFTPQTSHRSKAGSSRKGLQPDEVETILAFLGQLFFFQFRFNIKKELL